MDKIIELPGIPDSIAQVEQFIEELRVECGFREDVCGNVIIAVTEAVNNSIYHGSKCNPEKKFSLRVFRIAPYKISISVEDDGPGFNPESLPDPTSPDLIDKPGGRGVFLMRNLADQVVFEEEGRRVILFFNI
jgi:serine/threonine-protein kinase RsbW